MSDAVDFGALALAVSGAGLLAVQSHRLAQRVRIPTPAFFLVFQGRDSAYALPKAVLAPGAVADARALLREKMGDRARLAKAG